jgi:hypothetical protein
VTRDAQLAALEARIGQLDDPTALVALATEIDTLGVELAAELRGVVSESDRVVLARVLARVPAVHVRALLRAAERFDDAGSPRRAAFVLVEALRVAFDPEMLATTAAALAFVLEAHGQAPAAARVGDVVTASPRTRFLAAVDAVRAAIDWSALDDELGFD